MSRRGQAVVEFALVLPLFLFLILEGLQLSMIALAVSRFDFAIQRAVLAGAAEPAVPQRCGVAEDTLLRVLQRPIDSFRCTAIGDDLTVTASRHFAAVSPFHDDPIRIEASAIAPVAR